MTSNMGDPMQRLSISGVTLFFVIALLASLVGNAIGEGELSEDLIERIQANHDLDNHSRAMYNAITNNNVNDLALNRDLLQGHNEVFSHKIKAKGVTNQKSSGRCWLFAGLNILRPAIIENYKLGSFEFSQNYLAFWDKMEKANTFLERIIEYRDTDLLDREMEIVLRSPFPDGGWWKYVVDLIDKYGVVPKDVMPETNSSESTGMMNRLISRKLRVDAVELRAMHAGGASVLELRTEKEAMLSEVYRMLVMNLGEPPSEFPFRYEDRDSNVSEMRVYSPNEFYDEFVQVDLHEYVNIFNYPSQEYGGHYKIDLSSNMYDKDDINFANVEIDILKMSAMNSVLDDEPVWFACDVGKDQSRQHGIMAMNVFDYNSIYSTELEMSKSDRAMFRESAPNHAMVFVGVDVKDGEPQKWLVENSWGTSKGSGGYWTLYDTWFDNHVYNVIVKKKYVPKDVLEIYEREPIVLPAWDPMYNMTVR